MTELENEKTSKIVSVVIPTYNRAHLIGRAIQSVLNQTYQNFEIIVVDDASRDNMEEVVKSFSDMRIRYIRHNKNKGGAAARNTGIRVAAGEYISFLDDDDEFLPEMLEKLLVVIENNNNIDLVFASGKVVKDGKVTGDRAKVPWVNRIKKEDLIMRIFIADFIPIQGTIVRKEKLLKVNGFDESVPSSHDHELWMRLVPICNVHFIDEPLFNQHFSQKCITTNVKQRLVSQIKIFKKNSNILKSHVGAMEYYYIRQKYLSNVFSTAAWDMDNRKGNKKLTLLLYGISFIMFPNTGLLSFMKKELTKWRMN